MVAVVLRQDMTSANIPSLSRYMNLLFSGFAPNGVAPAKIDKITAVEVHPISGDYAILTTLSNCPASNNQALWTGNTLVDSAGSGLRFPKLRLRKGDRYSTSNTPLGTIKSISLKPGPRPGGAGGTGLATCIGADGSTAVFITGSSNQVELVMLAE